MLSPTTPRKRATYEKIHFDRPVLGLSLLSGDLSGQMLLLVVLLQVATLGLVSFAAIAPLLIAMAKGLAEIAKPLAGALREVMPIFVTLRDREGNVERVVEVKTAGDATPEQLAILWPAIAARAGLAMDWRGTERAAQVCGVPVEQVRSLARDYGTLGPAAIRLNYGMQRVRGGGAAARARWCRRRSG